MTKTEGALSGVKILSFAQLAQGPSAVQYLADLGADVIKVERPSEGAWERSWSGLDLFIKGESAFFLSLNRNQRSLTVNLKEEEGKEIISRLVREVDVLVENFRPGVMERLGLGYDGLSEINPRLIYASASGYGSSGPYRDKAGQDLLAQSLGGLASVTGRKDDFPTPVGAPIVDIHAGSLMSMGILAALRYREKSGKGQKVEVSLLDSAIDMQMEPLFYFLNGGGKRSIQRSRSGIGTPFSEAPYGIYKTKNGFVAISLTPIHKLARVLGMEELAKKYSQEDALEKRDEIKECIQQEIINKNTEDLLAIFDQNDVWCAPVKNYEELAEDPQVKYNEVILEMEREDIGQFKVIHCPIKLSLTKPTIRRPPPRLGEHTDEILRSLGYDDNQIAKMNKTGVV